MRVCINVSVRECEQIARAQAMEERVHSLERELALSPAFVQQQMGRGGERALGPSKQDFGDGDPTDPFNPL